MDDTKPMVQSGGEARDLPSRQKRSELTRQTILAAAASEFAGKGYEGGSVRAIARSIGQEAALVQYHFGDKLALWGAVLDDVIGRFDAELHLMLARCAGRPAAELICNFFEAVIRHAADHPVFVGIISHARIEQTPHARAYQERVNPRAKAVMELIAKAQRDGDFIPGDPTLLFYQLIGAALRMFMNGADVMEVMERRLWDGPTIDRQVELCIRLFMPDVGRSADGVWTARSAAASASPGRTTAALPPSEAGADGDRPRPTTFFLLTSLDGLIRRNLDEQLVNIGLTQAQMIALIRIADEHRLSSARLARMLEVTPQAVTLFVKALEAKGLIRRRIHPSSRRTLQIEVTAAGAEVLRNLRRIVAAAEAELMDGLSFEERGALRGLLERVLRRQRPQWLSDWSPLMLPG